MTIRHFLKLADFSADELNHMLDRALWIKSQQKAGTPYEPFKGKVLAMIFEKASTRTRVSFEAGFYQLGGNVIHLTSQGSQLGRSESIEDTARVISRMVDLVMIRTFGQDRIEAFSRYSKVPVINGLTDEYHPVQIMTDIMTFMEHRGSIKGKRVAWVGDANNMSYSWLEAAKILGFHLSLAIPEGYELDTGLIPEGTDYYTVTRDPIEACKDADLVTTDVWTSMGFEEENAKRMADFADYQVNARVMAAAKPDALFMHCLPAHRGEEVTAEVIDGPQSVVWDEAENRLHAQKGIMEFCLLGKV
jgi:ornithine carbamoyltransferase